MTTTGFVSATRDETAPTRFSRVAAGSSLLLDLLLVVVLPALAQAAFYVGVLTSVAAANNLVAGYVLWARATMMARAMSALGAGATLAGVLLQAAGAFPGVSGLPDLTRPTSVVAIAVACGISLCLFLDARRRRPEPPLEHPYAL